MKWAVLFGAVVLAGCQTQQIQEMNYSERKALAEQIVQRCYAQGVKADTPEMRLCTAAEVQAENAKRQNNLAQARRSQRAIAQGLQNASRSYPQAAATVPQTTTCTRVPSPSGYATVRCY